MNENIIDMLGSRSTNRSYTGESLKSGDLDKILRAVQRMPSSINGQQCSVIVIEDAKQREDFNKLLSMPQPHIMTCGVLLIFCVDFHKALVACEKHNVQMESVKYLDAYTVGTVDCGIMIGATTIVAETLGYGTVALGAIRNNLEAVCDFLNLPKYVLPICGMCLGVIKNKHNQRPKLPFETFAHYGNFDAEAIKKDINVYDEQVLDFYKQIGSSAATTSWSELIARYYNGENYRETKHVAQKQGFDFIK